MNGSHAKSRRGHWVVGLALLLGVAGALWLYLHAKADSDAADPEAARKSGEPIPVRTVRVERSAVDQVIGATAVSEPSASWTVQVGSNTTFSGADVVVKTVDAVEGDFVKKGQVLFRLNELPFAENLTEEEETVRAAQATLDRSLAQIAVNQKLRKIELTSSEDEIHFRDQDWKGRTIQYLAEERLNERLWANIVELYDTKSQYLAARYAHQEAERRRTRALEAIALGKLQDEEMEKQARQLLAEARNDLAQARRDLERCAVKSPIDGYMDKLPLTPGAIVPVNTPLSTVSTIDPIHVRMDFPQERIDEIYAGQEAEVVFDSHPKETFSGRVVRINPLVNTQLRVLPVVVRLPNPNHRLRPGVSAFVRLHSRKTAMTVPSAAVIEGRTKAMVFRVEDGRARMRAIRTGFPLENGTLEVLGGLNPGDEIVLYSNLYSGVDKKLVTNGLLQDNDRVDTDWRRWAKRD